MTTPTGAPDHRKRSRAAVQETLRRLDAMREARGQAPTEDSVLLPRDRPNTALATTADLDEQSREQTVMRAALAVLIERSGGQIEYTEADYVAVMRSRGPHRLEGVVDRSRPGGPVICMRLAPRPQPEGRSGA